MIGPLRPFEPPTRSKTKIGIIGAGQIGGTLTRRLTLLGHKVFVANSRGPETLRDLTAETGATAVSVREAVRDVDLVVVTIPEKSIPSLPAGLFADTDERVVVVDTGNYYPQHRDGRIEAIEAGTPEVAGSSNSWAGPSSRRSTTSLLNTCWSWVDLQARAGASPSRLQATTTQPKPLC
jgi:NADP oxidoreductase coenzyme F420-dependent